MKEGFGKFLILVGWALVVLAIGFACHISGIDFGKVFK